jgi:hypothetical protein
LKLVKFWFALFLKKFNWNRTFQELRKAIISIDQASLVRSLVANNPSTPTELLEVLKDDILRTAFTFNGQAILINKNNTTGIIVRSYLKNDI